jgi:hypothetical protein
MQPEQTRKPRLIVRQGLSCGGGFLSEVFFLNLGIADQIALDYIKQFVFTDTGVEDQVGFYDLNRRTNIRNGEAIPIIILHASLDPSNYIQMVGIISHFVISL